MPIDDDLLELKVKDLEIKLKSLEQERHEIKEILNNLSDIKKIEHKTQSMDEGGMKTATTIVMKDPIDKTTGSEITVIRRQEIYDTNVSRADDILNS